MKKFFFLSLIALMGISQAWAETVTSANNTDDLKDGKVVLQAEHVTFTLAGDVEITDGGSWAYKLGTLKKNTSASYAFTWACEAGYGVQVTGISFEGRGYRWAAGDVASGVMEFNGESKQVGSIAVTNNDGDWTPFSATAQFTSGIEVICHNKLSGGLFDKDFDYYIRKIAITYTLIPPYTVVFNGNGNTDGSMEDQKIGKDESKALTANAFERVYTVTYDANGGDCLETSADAAYTFKGWALSADGAAVYTDGQTVTNMVNPGETVDLFALWNSASVVLPEPSNEGSLFNGWYDGENWAGKAGDAYTPTADVTLQAHWAEKLTPMFVLDKSEIELEQVATLNMSNVQNPTIEIAPEGIVEFNSETGELTALALGKVTITCTQEAVGNLEYKHEELELTVTRKTPSLTVLLNGQMSFGTTIIQGHTATVSFDKVSDAEVQVAAVSGAECASYKDGVLTAGEIGTAVFRATLPETDTYKTTYVDFSIKVEADPIHLPLTMSQTIWNDKAMLVASEGTNSWSDEKGIVLGDADGGGFNMDDKYIILHFEGIPNVLSFEISTDVIGIGQALGGATNVEWFIQEGSTSEVTEAKIWTETRADNTFSDTYTVQLQPSTRYVKFCYSGNFAGCFRNVQISELKYVQDPEPASIDFGTAVINTGEIQKTANINWCNVATMNVVSSNPRFTVSPSSFANYDLMGSQEITISYTHTNEVGAQEADITISNDNAAYTKTIHVSANTIKRVQEVAWNENLVATGFAMNVGEQYPDETIKLVATVPSGERVTFTSSDPDIIEVIADTALLAKAVGTAEITAYQAGDAEYDEANDTKTFTVTNLQKQSITWNQNLYGLLTTSEPVELTATATSGMEVRYESANEDVVRIEGKTLIVVGEGETSIKAIQDGGKDDNEEEWLPISLNNYVIVRNPASQCNEMALSVGSLVLNGSNLSQEFALEGAPTSLTFSAQHGKKDNGAWFQNPTYAALMVDQYTKVDGVWGWQTIYNQVVETSATPSGTLELDEIATKVRFRTTETGTDHTISDIRIPRKKFMRADVEAIDTDIEANAIWQQTITVSHSNIDLMTVTAQEGLLTISTATLGEGCGDFGDDVFTVTFTPAAKNVEYNDVIIITDGKEDPTTIEIPVRLFTTGLNQYISGFELPESCLLTDEIEIPAVTATSGLEVTFLSSDEEIAYVEDGKLVILKGGTVDITAYQAGDDKYNEASVTKTIEIKKLAVVVNELPTASNIELGQALSSSVLKGGSATVAGSFAWEDPDLVPEVGAHAFAVIFTPEESDKYAEVKVEVEVLVEDNSEPIDPSLEPEAINWVPESTTLDVADGPQMLEISTQSGRAFDIESTDETIAYIEYDEGNDIYYLVPVAKGEVTIKVSVEADEVYNAAHKNITFIITDNAGEETGFENAEDAVKAVKVLRNGQIYILRDGKVYTVSGLLVE